MSNFSLKINVEDLPGARVMEITTGPGRSLLCACIPVDNFKGFCTNAYVNSRNEVKTTKHTTLNFSAYELRESKYGDSHCLRASLARDAMQQMTEEQVETYIESLDQRATAIWAMRSALQRELSGKLFL